MTLKTEGRRFVQELRRNRRARLLAHQTIASMDGGWWGGILQNRMRPVVLTAAARRGCLSTRVRPRDAARACIATWRDATLQERSAAQEHVLDRCRLLDEPTPAEADPTGATYCVERGARTDTGGDGWADVWKRSCFAWEYNSQRAHLDAAFAPLRQDALARETPPLLNRLRPAAGAASAPPGRTASVEPMNSISTTSPPARSVTGLKWAFRERPPGLG